MSRDRIPSADGLELTMHHGDDGSILRLRGCLNIDSSPALRDRLLAMGRAQSPEPVVVDLAEVTYVDSSGIATLIEGLKLARMRQARLCVQGLQGRLSHLFQVTGVSALFEKNGCTSPSSKAKVS
jgi:anti-sigma B factor antagonist